LAYLWKKNHIYTIIQYDDGHDIQTIVIDFHKNVDYAQALIYKKMLEYRNKDSEKSPESSDNKTQTEHSGSPIKFWEILNQSLWASAFPPVQSLAQL
jgi:hypothetical protein